MPACEPAGNVAVTVSLIRARTSLPRSVSTVSGFLNGSSVSPASPSRHSPAAISVRTPPTEVRAKSTGLPSSVCTAALLAHQSWDSETSGATSEPWLSLLLSPGRRGLISVSGTLAITWP